ncbi:MAG TPA: methylamine utilization protein [Luteibacter sp.]|uniref:methylamine utilization protein n=1 Tax=Luteibacter sp. TaxID=1886636 RepID=UPI002BC8068B|nr:methylamine utilization protein [Luteibacter sp.]HVI56766.1 methylamine utilization protein [Luteibacter sp.]
MRSLFAIATVLILGAAPAHAGRVVIEVVDTSGHPIADAVVSLAPMPGTTPRAIVPATRYVDQKDETFLPYVTALHPGDSVIFRNSDTTRHHVYSFSDMVKFEYMLGPGESSPALAMTNPGNAAVGCNIHDQMLTYLYVTKDPEMATTDAQGRASIEGVMAGQYRAHAWHPQLRPGVTLPIQGVTVGDAVPATVHFNLALLPDPRGAMDREHLGY